MRRFHWLVLLSLLGVLIGPLTVGSAQQDDDHSAITTLEDGLIMYFPFTGSADDASGNRLHGTVFGPTLTADRYGRADEAYRFDGIDDYIALPDFLDVIDTEFSFSAWIVPYDYGTLSPVSDTCVRMIFDYRMRSEGSGSSANSGFHASLSEGRDCAFSDDPRIGAAFIDKDYGYNHAWFDYGLTERWFLFTVVRETDQMILYIDDEQVHTNGAVPLPVYLNPDHPLSTIGAYRAKDVFAFPFEGVIDEVRLYDRALSADEVHALYEQ